MFKAIVGHSTDVDSEDAIAEILEQCQFQLGHQLPQAGLLFAAMGFDYGLILARIQTAFPGIQLIGCTTDGEISSVHGFQEDSISLMLFCSDTVTMHAGLGQDLSNDAIKAANQAIDNFKSENLQAVKLCIVLPDGLTDGTEVTIRQLQSKLPPNTPIIGGLAGDQYQFKQTYQFYQDKVVQNGLPILVFCGALNLSHGVASGWQPLSRSAIVTKSEKEIVYEIDHQPATQFYRDYTGDQPIMGEYPLAVFEADSDSFYLRASNQWDVDTNSIHFMGEVPEQATVQITYATHDQIIAATKTSIEQAVSQYAGTQPAAAFFVSCAARRWLLGDRAKEEYELSQQSLNSKIPVIGFYAYGEIAPLSMQGQSCYHQETLVTLLLGVD